MFLRYKTDVADEIISFIKTTEVLLDKRVWQLRSDHRTEFKNATLENFCDEKGIYENFSAIRSPEKSCVF